MARRLCCLILIQLFASLCQAKLYKYSELEVKNYDEMSKIVHEKIRLASRIDLKKQRQSDKKGRSDYDEFESIEVLKDSLRLIFSRPNKDNLVEKLLPDVRRELNNYGAYYDSLNDIVVEAVNGVSQKIPVVYRSTFIFILENVMSELRPDLKGSDEVKKIFTYIRDANLEIPNDVKLDRKLRSMYRSDSPSLTARKVLKAAQPKKKKTKGFWERLFG